MEQDATTEVVYHLMVAHARSLATFLAHAHPWDADQQQHSRQAVAEIARDQLGVADRLGRWLVRQGYDAALPPYAPRFASLHDLSAAFLWPELQRQQDLLIAALSQALPQLQGTGRPERILQEALGMAKAHRDQLDDPQTMPRAAHD